MNDNIEIDIRKALDTGVTSTGAVLIPEDIDPGIRVMVETRSPLWAMMPKVTAETNAWSYKEQTGIPTASFGSELGAFPAATSSTYVDRTMPIKQIYVRGEVSNLLRAASKSFVNVVSREVNNAALAMARAIEIELIAGDSTANANKIDGLNKQITQIVYADTNNNGTGTDQPLTLKKLDELIDKPQGSEPTHLIMSKDMRRKIWSIIQPQVRYIDKNTVNAGLEVPTYAGKPIVELFDNASILGTSILAPDMSLVYVPILVDITYHELPMLRDSLDFLLKMYFCLVVEGAARHHAKLTDVTSTIS